MRRRTTWLVGGAVAVLVLGSAGLAVGLAGDDIKEQPITGTALDRATSAALEHTDGGDVTGTEVGDEEGYYEVEVTLENGRQVDVHLDRDFAVVGDESDDEADDAGGDD